MAARSSTGGVHAVGFFDEFSPGWGFPTDGPIEDAVRPQAGPDEDRLVSYLRDGAWIWAEMSAQRDVLDCDGPTLVGAGSLRTDGIWIWREDLPYYVVTYHLALPDEFVARARELSYVPPEVPESTLIQILTRDLRVPMASS